MSRFEDLKDYKNNQEASKNAARDQLNRKASEAKDKYLPQIQKAYSILGDFYTTILKPQRYGFIPRKKEQLTPSEQEHMHYNTILYAYVANITSPFDKHPYKRDFDDPRNWTSPEIKEYDAHVWHPNVALQFSSEIISQDLEANNIQFTISMRVWGDVEIDKNLPLLEGVAISSADGGWNRRATILSLDPDKPNFENQLEFGLRLLAPNILNHKEVFEKAF